MADRRHAADREAGLGADEVGVGAADRLAENRADLGLVDAVDARGDDQHRAPRRLGAEDERLGDLRHRATDRRRRLGGGAGARVEFEHLIGGAERGLDLQGAGGGRGLHRAADRKRSTAHMGGSNQGARSTKFDLNPVRAERCLHHLRRRGGERQARHRRPCRDARDPFPQPAAAAAVIAPQPVDEGLWRARAKRPTVREATAPRAGRPAVTIAARRRR